MAERLTLTALLAKILNLEAQVAAMREELNELRAEVNVAECDGWLGGND